MANTNFAEDLLPNLQKEFGKIDIIINNAGTLINKPYHKLTDEDFDMMFNTNVKSIFKLIRDLLPIINPKAHIVNISSMGGFQGSSKFPGLSLIAHRKAH